MSRVGEIKLGVYGLVVVLTVVPWIIHYFIWIPQQMILYYNLDATLGRSLFKALTISSHPMIDADIVAEENKVMHSRLILYFFISDTSNDVEALSRPSLWHKGGGEGLENAPKGFAFTLPESYNQSETKFWVNESVWSWVELDSLWNETHLKNITASSVVCESRVFNLSRKVTLIDKMRFWCLPKIYWTGTIKNLSLNFEIKMAITNITFITLWGFSLSRGWKWNLLASRFKCIFGRNSAKNEQMIMKENQAIE